MLKTILTKIFNKAMTEDDNHHCHCGHDHADLQVRDKNHTCGCEDKSCGCEDSHEEAEHTCMCGNTSCMCEDDDETENSEHTCQCGCC